MSAIAPAGSASSITGRLSAASTSATIEGDEDSEVISHPAPTSCIQVPMFETMVAIHNPRNSPFLSGLQGEGAVMADTLYARARFVTPAMFQRSAAISARWWGATFLTPISTYNRSELMSRRLY